MANTLQKYLIYRIKNGLYLNNLYHDTFNNTSLSRNPSITWDFVLKYPQISWNYAIMCANPNISFDIFKNNLLDKSDEKTIGRLITLNPNITLDDVLANPDIDWDMQVLQSHPNITFDMVGKYPFTNISMEYLSRNPNITDEIVLANTQLKWDINALAYNPLITIETLDIYTKIYYGYKTFSAFYSLNPNLTVKYIAENLKYAWKFDLLLTNPAFGYSEIKQIHKLFNQNIDKCHLINKVLGKNPNLTFDQFKSTSKFTLEYVTNNPNTTYEIIIKYFNRVLNNIDNNRITLHTTYISNISHYNYQLYNNNLTFDKYVYRRKCKELINTAQFIIKQLTQYISQYV